MFNIQNMYTATVLKILQQAVEEIKRGLKLLKQQQDKSLSSTNVSSAKSDTDLINSVPKSTTQTPELTPSYTQPNSASKSSGIYINSFSNIWSIYSLFNGLLKKGSKIKGSQVLKISQ